MRVTPPPPGLVHPRATEVVAACPACGGADAGFFYWGRSLYNEYWHAFKRCPACGLVFVSPRVPAGEAEARVQSGSGAEQVFLRKLPFDLPEIGTNIVWPVITCIHPYILSDPGGISWLDVGCGIGNLLEVAATAEFEPTGLELNEGMVRWAAEHRPHLNIRQGLLRDLPPGAKFDVISADNVLEHMHDPAGFLREARGRLLPGGLLVVRVPNFNNFARPLLQLAGRLPRCWMTDPDAHPCIWSRRALLAVLARTGFRPVRIMEHLMVSYPLKHILGGWTGGKRRAAERLYPLAFWPDRLVPRGGIDITVIAQRDSAAS